MEDYGKDGFEVEKFVDDGQFLVYSRRVVTVDKSEGDGPGQSSAAASAR